MNQKSPPKKTTPYKLTQRQRDKIIKEYASGNYSTRQLGKKYEVSHTNITHLVKRHISTFQQYKKEFRAELEGEMTKLARKTAKHAIKNYDKLTPYQAVTATAIVHDKLYAQPNQINIGDNRSINVSYPNWNKNKRTRGK